jgi:hypothetical protein
MQRAKLRSDKLISEEGIRKAKRVNSFVVKFGKQSSLIKIAEGEGS